MENKQILQNVIAIAEKAQKAGLFTLEESSVVLQTLKSLNEILNDEQVEEEKPNE